MLEYPSPFALDGFVSDGILPQGLALRSRKQVPETVKKIDVIISTSDLQLQIHRTI